MPDSTFTEDLPRDLHYVDHGQPGIRRKNQAGKFRYYDAKDFPTWAGTVMALAALRELEWQPESDAQGPQGRGSGIGMN